MNRRSRLTSLLSQTPVLLAIACAPIVGRAATVATPTFSPVAGSYTGAQSVTLSDTTSGATIYYTITAGTTGTTPTSSSTKYTGAFTVSATSVVEAIAELSGDTNSSVASAAYTITVPTPTFSPAAGSYTGTQSVTIADATSGATCYYTLTAGTTGTTPTTSSTKYTAAISVTASSVLESLCTYTGDTNSAVASAKYTITAPVVATPTISPVAGSYTGSQSVSITDTTSGATIYYTVTAGTTGTTPTSSSTKYTGAFTASATSVVEAIAELTGDTNSSVASAAYTITVPTPTFSPIAGSYSGTQSVTIADATSGATCYYTLTAGTTGTTPTTSSTKYTAAISVTASSVLESLCTYTGDTNSAVASAKYTITAPVVATPTFSPVAGNYTGSQSVSISDTTSGATIYYTVTAGTTGTTPTSSSTKYTGAFTVSATSVVEAIAELTGDTNSSVASAAYTITVPTPTFSPVAGSYTGSQSVTLSDTTSGATIYYTVTAGTTGTTPTSSSTKYTGAFTVSATSVVEAIAELTGDTNSSVASAAYTITVPTPTFSPIAGSYSGTQSVTISDATAGATCYYTLTAGTTGTTPTTSSTKYTAAISVTASSVLEALCTYTGDTNSAINSATYTITAPAVATPTFSPVAGSYTGSQSVSISDTTSGATIYYTITAGTTGTTPTSSSTKYTGAFTVSVTSVVEAIAEVTGESNSAVASATYTIVVPSPTFNPPPGNYIGTQSVTISDALSGATIYYTTNGTNPTTSSTKYTAPISVSRSETIEAIAVYTGDTSSPVTSGIYTITVPTPTFSEGTGTYGGTQSITISDATYGATCYYTLTAGTTGSTPTTSSTKYSGAISVTVNSVLEALCTYSSDTNSAVATAAYTIVPATSTPTFSPVAGTYASQQTVSINDTDPAATVYYTQDGSTPTYPITGTTTEYSNMYPVTVYMNTTLKAIAVDPAYANSPVATAAYLIQAQMPIFSPVAGSYVGPQSVSLIDYSNYTNIYYTTDGSTPTTSSTQFINGTPIVVNSSETINAIAASHSYSKSPVASAPYTITSVVATPVISPSSGSFPRAQFVTINEPSLNATVYYTLTSGTTGTMPTTSSDVYTTGGVISINSTETLEAIAVVPGYTSSSVATATYTLPAIAASTTTLAMTSGGSPVSNLALGSAVTLTATVASGTTKVTTGTVNFCDATATYCTDIHLLGTAQLTSAGTAAINLLPGVGVHSYKAIFVGTSSYSTSSSSSAQLTIITAGGHATATGITAMISPPNGYTASAQVVGLGNYTVAPTGTVSILDTSNGNAVLGTGSLSPSGTGIEFTNASTLPFPQIFNNNSNVIVVGDFKGNGMQDMAVMNGNTVTILLSNGNGTFTQANGSPIAVYGGIGVAGDFNGDGILDLVVFDNDGDLTFLRGNGDGTFVAGNSAASVCPGPVSVATSDFNRDGELDLAVSCAATWFGGSGTVTILLGNGDGTFTQASGSPIAVSNSTSSIAAGDFNGDGFSDLAVIDWNDGVSILLGNGDGTFTQAPGSPITINSLEFESVAVGDFNGDGKLDLAVVSYYYSVAYILLGNGDGTFTQWYSASVGNGPESVAVADFDQDGIPDLAVVNNYDSTISILKGFGNGSFGEFVYPISLSAAPEFVAVGDFYGSGIPDLAVTTTNSSVTILQTSAGEIATATIAGVIPLGFGTHNIDASYGGDSNYTGSSSGTIPLTATPKIGLSPNSGIIGAPVTITGTGFGTTTGTVTFNGTSATITNWTNTSIQTSVPTGATTGYVVVTVGGIASNGALFTVVPPFYLSVTSGTVNTPVTITGPNFGTTTGTVTFNGTPATITNWTNTSIQTSVPTGATTGYVVVTAGGTSVTGPTFTVLVAASTTLAITSGGNSVTTVVSPSLVTLTATVASGTTPVTTGTVNFCDATATHCTDIHRLGTAQLTSAGTAAIKFWPSVGSHSYKAIFVGTSTYMKSSSSNAQLTVTGGDPTLTTIGSSGVAGNYTLTATVTGVLNNSAAPTGTVSILDTSNANAVLGTGSLSGASTGLNFSIVSTPGTGINPGDIAVGDFNGDGRLDMAVPNCADGTVTVLLGNGDGTFTAASGSPITVGSEPCFVAVGDFRGSGSLDLAVANYGNGTITILQGNGDGTFTASPQGPISVGNFPGSMVVGDFNGDGHLDLAVTNDPNSDTAGTVTVLLGNGDGTFTAASGSPVKVGSNPISIAIGDFNGDGTSDLAVSNWADNTVTILLGNGDGTFAPASGSPITAGSGPYTIAVADLDGDGNLDLAIANDEVYSVVTMMGNGDGTFKPLTTIATPIAADAIAVGDFNGDGIPDLAISAHSSNTVAALLGNGDGTFSTYTIPFNIGSAPSYSVAAGDFNGDGVSDLAVANQGFNMSTWTAVNGTITILQPSAGETATVTINGISPLGFGFHNAEARYGGNGTFAASTSIAVPLVTAGIETLPVLGPVGSLFTILGSGFGTAQETSSITVGGLAAVPTAWSDTQLQALVPNGLGIGPQSVVVTVAGQSTSGTFTVTPGITVITPSSGLPGTPVSITGTNFGATQGTSTVTFNGTTATSISYWSTTSIMAVVPPGAITGSVVVTVNSVASNGVPFTVPVPPTISSLSPTSGVVGTPVTIAGLNFGASQGTSTVTFNGTAATISNWSATSIAAVVPSGATSGNVVVTVNGNASNGAPFTVLTVTLTSSSNPSSYGTSITFTATFSISGLAGSVTFMDSGTQIGAGTITGTTATYTTSSLAVGTHSITASWPGNSTYPQITSSPVLQKIQSTPAVYSLSPTSGVVGTPVTIAGINFGASQGTSTVTFNGTAATISNWSATSIAAVVPSGATSGNVVVTVNGNASNGAPFTVLTVTLTSSSNPSSYGSSITFTATFSVSGLAGSVTFMDSGTQIGAGTITGTTATYKTSSLAVGTHSITASWPGNSTYPPITSSPVLQKIQNTPAVYSWPWASNITFGQTLASSQLIGGSAAVSGTFAWTAPGTVAPVGAATESVTFTPSDTTDYSSVTGSAEVTVDPIGSPASSTNVTYTYDNLGRVYQAQYSTSSGTITVTYSYDSAGNRTSVVTQ